MSDLASHYDYELPAARIAQKPASPREAAKLMVLDRARDARLHKKVRDLPEFFRPGDLLVMNVSKVFNARLRGTVLMRGQSPPSAVELFLVRPGFPSARQNFPSGRKLVPGDRIEIAKNFSATVEWKDADGSFLVGFGKSSDAVMRLANRHGHVPTPPYIKRTPRRGDYQTVYAKHEGSVAAPTAGFHLTKALLAKLKRGGVRFAEVTLHVGLGTFQPIRSSRLDEHRMHAEWVEIPKTAVREILAAKSERRRVAAIGTTTVRALEGAVRRCGGELCAWHGDVDLFISPGFEFQVVDALLTNFHLPKSTLLVLVSAFAGRRKILAAYEEAMKKRYRFYSFGDAMLII